MASKIEWTDRTWNPLTGCDKVSPGCRGCYAETMAVRLRAMGQPEYKDAVDDRGRWTGKITLIEDRVEDPLRWRKPSMIFVNSMTDLFHKDVPDEFICRIFRTMGKAHWHTFQILTKRPERMEHFMRQQTNAHAQKMLSDPNFMVRFPYPNVWMGTSVENQEVADERIAHLRSTPAAVRFLSYEPALGPIDFRFAAPPGMANLHHGLYREITEWQRNRIHWVICGGESGITPRPMHPDWARSARDQCQAAGVPFFFKQWGAWKPISEMSNEECEALYHPAPERDPEAIQRCRVDTRAVDFHGGDNYSRIEGHCGYMTFKVGKKNAGRVLDGRLWDEWPTNPGGNVVGAVYGNVAGKTLEQHVGPDGETVIDKFKLESVAIG